MTLPLRHDKPELYSNADPTAVVGAVLRVLPPGGRVLDLGCASGGLLGELEGRAGFRAGVELSPVAAARAAEVADQVVTASIPSELPFEPASFDVVVCADVLEHVVDSEAALAWASRWCRPGGAVVISIPNVANWQARLRLLCGRWDYEDCGLFDNGHLRFFTRKTLGELVESGGLVMESCVAARLPPVGMQIPGVNRLPLALTRPIGFLWSLVGNPLARRWPTLFGYQFLCVARPAPAGAPDGRRQPVVLREDVPHE